MNRILFLLFIGCCVGLNVLYLPLDERFTTRFAFLNLAKSTNFKILTPPMSMLPSRKTPPDLHAIEKWVDQNIPNADVMIASAEMYIYGGLISSRCSNDTQAQVLRRMKKLVTFQQAYPNLKLFLSTVVMRIPAYNEDEEEPWFWKYYGFDLYTYSFYSDKFQHTHNQSDEQQAQEAAAKVPTSILQEFLWRRSRNFNVTEQMIELFFQNQQLIQRLYITQDDNAQFGFNIEEANKYKQMVQQYNLTQVCRIYPGADEVGFTLLAQVSALAANESPKVQFVFRDPSSIFRIPNYEGQPMIYTLQDQLVAAGGTAVNSSDPDIYLLVNNFSEEQQIEAPNQPMNRTFADFEMFLPYLTKGKVIGFADNRYSNGADIIFCEWIEQQAQDSSINLKMQNFAYAGWNTNGNTLGTVIGNSIVLSLFKSGLANTYFNSLRLLEDWHWQAELRQTMESYIDKVPSDSYETLSNDLEFYEHYSFKVMNSELIEINEIFQLNWTLDSIYYPWNRTFEIGYFAH